MSVIQHRSGIQREVRRSEKVGSEIMSLPLKIDGRYIRTRQWPRAPTSILSRPQRIGERMSRRRHPRARGYPMIPVVKAKLIEGKRGLIVGIANEQSIAWGCAKAFRAFGAE